MQGISKKDGAFKACIAKIEAECCCHNDRNRRLRYKNKGLLIVRREFVILNLTKLLTMDAIIEELKQKPNLKSLVDELNEILKEEDKRREEFYNTITEDDKAEFINGEVIMHSPVKIEHAEASMLLSSLMHLFALRHNLGEVFTEKVMIQLTRNSYEPDIVFFGKEKAKSFEKKQMLFPAPDLIVEILSPSTEKSDRGVKFTDYALHGIQEYWLIDPQHQFVEQYILQNSNYELETKIRSGMITSKVLTGFAIEAKAIFDKEESRKALQQILLT